MCEPKWAGPDELTNRQAWTLAAFAAYCRDRGLRLQILRQSKTRKTEWDPVANGVSFLSGHIFAQATAGEKKSSEGS